MTSTHMTIVESDAIVVSMTRARTALIEAKTIGQTKKIIDVAAAAEIYAKRQHMSEEAIDLALSVKIEALRRLGEILTATPKAKGVIRRGTKSAPRGTPTETLAELGLTKKDSAIAQKLFALPDEAFAQVREGHVTVAKAIAAVTAQKDAPPARASAKATAHAPEADGADLPTVSETLVEQEQEIARLLGLVKAADADDQKAEALKWRRACDAAVRGQSEAMDRAHKSVEREKVLKRALMRCGKAVGEDDEFKIAAAVEAMARTAKVAA